MMFISCKSFLFLVAFFERIFFELVSTKVPFLLLRTC